eukprot:CAMPEP_0201913776 /NCGR_PEP_ID=MMETSP0903-20130614/4138_1 /ASSEMBLY_ACC=CAM_ASM_000552 /TAXON_ID=420261 /ORGANISM="Thalassiosira antarctica, Strain CCMP982" /LENGTH=329 /DNA_ID=CAMNT_0048449041 /DNA_START=135 /DNA_END=1124 /DNA_ORIENTATION=-
MVYTPEDLLIEISDRLRVMRTQEVSQYFVPDYLAEEWQKKLRGGSEQDEDNGSSQPTAAVPSSSSSSCDGNHSSSSDSDQINELWRGKICEWCYQVVDHFDFNRDVVSVTMSYLDRYLATRAVNRRIFQLAAITALYLAIKLFEPGTLHMSNLVHLSRGYFTAEHIMSMENTMFQTLNWHVHPPTPYAFCSDLMILVPGDITPCVRHDMQELARFLTELSVCDYWFATRKPSSIALASIINAIELQGPYLVDAKYKAEFLHRVVGIGMDIAHDDEIIECYTRLRQIYDAGGYNPNLVEGLDAEEADGPLVDHAVSPGADNHESPRSIIL